MTSCTKNEIDFTVFIMHRLANRWGRTVPETYQLLTKAGIMDDYIIAHFDTLHSMGEEYLIEDITDFAREKGLAV